MPREGVGAKGTESGEGTRDCSWLTFIDGEGILICHTHGYAVLNLESHLKDRHKELPKADRDAALAMHSHVDLQPPPNDDFRHGPSNPRAPIAGLPAHRGWDCRICGKLTPSRKCMRVHYNDEHGTMGRVPKEPTVRMQTLFTGPKRAVHYFCVMPCAAEERASTDAMSRGGGGGRRRIAAGSEHDDWVGRIREQWAHDQSEQEDLQRVLADGAAKHETTNWLKRSGWTAHFVGRDLTHIYLCSRMPSAEDDEALLTMVAAMDSVFFDRCISGLTSMPLMTRLLLASPHPDDAESRPFGPLQEKTSMDRYLTYWKRFLCYCMRVLPLDEATLRKEHGFAFSQEQRRMLERLWARAGDGSRAGPDLEDELLRVSAGFWMQRLPGDPFDSPLWHFVGVLGIDGEAGQFRPAHLFTYVLAGLVYVGRALLAEHAIPSRERADMHDLEERFAGVRRAWLCKATYSPMGYTLSLLLYGRKIARETGSRLMVSWTKSGDVMYFMGKPIAMDAIRQMMEEMIADAEALLWGTLMFKEGDDARFAIPLAKIEDDLTHTHRGKSFIHSNGLAGKEVEMLEDLVSGGRRSEFLDKHGQWKWAAIRKYVQSAAKFDELTALLAHMCGGSGVARGEELCGIRRVNGINRDRGVFVVDGEMVLVTQYHKSQAHFDAPKVIPRFLPARVGQLLTMGLVYVKPLLDRWDAERWSMYGKMRPPSDFMWHDENGPWDSARISKAMARWTYYYLGRRLTFQDWRHISTATSKRHTRHRTTAAADFEEQDDIDEAERYEVPDDLAAAHSTETSNHYGVTMDILKRLTADSLAIFRQVSHRWHAFFRLDGPVTPACGALGAAVGERKWGMEGPPAAAAPRRPKFAKLERPYAELGRGQDGDLVLLEALRAVLRDDGARFRTPQQEEAVRLSAAKETPLVAVLPTGGGKSLVFMVPAMLAGAGVTVVVAPYAELKKQLVERCTEAGLDCQHWPQARDSRPRVVIVSGEAASSEDFLIWAADVATHGRLDRVVIDECHLTFTAALEYRKKLQGLVLLRNLGCPFVFLTGTLPPRCERDFEAAMQLPRPLYVRASSHRTSIRYSARRVGNGKGPMEIKRLLDSRLPLLGPGDKCLVYCRSHAMCRALAGLMRCHYYHADASQGDPHFLAQREEGFQAWLRGEAPCMVATAALGTGLNVPGIRYVGHLGLPHSIIDYAQETGRAGRAGESVEADIVVEDRDWPAEDDRNDAYLELSEREVNSLVRTKGCRRRALGQCLDNDSRDCKHIDGAVPCDNCQARDLAWKSELSSQGMIALAAFGRGAARGLERLRAALDEVAELGKMGCRVCWMFRGSAMANHSWYTCDKQDEALTFGKCMEAQRKVDYRKDARAKYLSCFSCHVSQELCVDGYKTRGSTCRWKHIVIPAAIASSHNAELWGRVQCLAGRELRDESDYVRWLGRKHGRLICGQEMTNAMAVFDLVLDWRAEQEAARSTVGCANGG